MRGVAALADEVALDIGGHLEQRGTGKVSLAHGSYGIGGAGARAGNQHAGLAGGAGVTVGHESNAQFQPAADESHAVLLVKKSVEKVQIMYADDPEDGVNLVGLQGFDNGLATGQIGQGKYSSIECVE